MWPVNTSCPGAVSLVRRAEAAGIASWFVISVTLVLRLATFAEAGHSFMRVASRCRQRAGHRFKSCTGPVTGGGVDQLLGQLHGNRCQRCDLFCDRESRLERLLRIADLVDESDCVGTLCVDPAGREG